MQPTPPVNHAARLRLAGLPILALALGACADRNFDTDLRGLAEGGFSTTEAAQAATIRPEPDARGVITYQNSQVVVARVGETVRVIAQRLGVDADEIGRYNGIAPDAPLRTGEIIALPSRVAGTPVGPGGTDITSLAGAAIDRAGIVTTQPLGSAGTAASGSNGTPFATASSEPVRHQVQRGETAYTISRLYNVPVADIAAWNGLGPDLTVREGQQLLIPLTGGTPPQTAGTTSQPGQGSATPVPPSASAPLPANAAAAAPAAPATPNLGSQQAAAPQARFARPVPGSIIRAYAPGRNEGIDIGAPAGTEVHAADAGTVAAITTNTEGIKIVVIRHSDGLLTVYTHLDNLTVQKDSTVSRGQVIGRVRAGDPSYLHFEVRRGMSSLDPTGFLP